MKRKLVTVDAETLLATPMSKTMFVVDGLIPQGVNVLSGAAKIGKSWLMLWLGLQVSQGLPVWGIPTMHCDVLYLCLEDTLRRIKDRLFDLTDDSNRSFHLSVTCGLIGNGLEEEIINFLEDFPKTKLVIIDTLQKVRDSKGSIGGKTGMFGNDYDDISAIKKIADERNISIILVHHLRKLKDGDDPFNEVSGSTGITGAADTNYVLKRKRSSRGRHPSCLWAGCGISGAAPSAALTSTSALARNQNLRQSRLKRPILSMKPKKSNGFNATALLPIALIAVLGAGGAYYFLKVRKRKPDTSGATDLDDYDFPEDDEDEVK